MTKEQLEQRGKLKFLSAINKDGPIAVGMETKCWIWQRYVFEDGYGGIMINRVFWRAHRYSYTLFNGEIPNGLHVLHKCDTPLCVNPEHLFVGTEQDNMQDCMSKDRNCKGEDHHAAKLTEEDVINIRKVYKKGCRINGARPLARRYNVSKPTIEYALFKGWRHVS